MTSPLLHMLQSTGNMTGTSNMANYVGIHKCVISISTNSDYNKFAP